MVNFKMENNNKFYYVVGLDGSGKTSICKQLAESVDGGIAIQSSGRFKNFIKNKGIEHFKELDLVDNNYREELINKFHNTFIDDKEKNQYSFCEGHMYVDNSSTGLRVNAMASENRGLANGIIFLNTKSRIIFGNIQRDNKSGKRLRNTKDIEHIKELSEVEFQAAESYCITNKLKFGILNNNLILNDFAKKNLKEVVYLNSYLLPQSEDLRTKYLQQFSWSISPSRLRKLHHSIGQSLVRSFFKKTLLNEYDYQVISVDRSGNYIANGFIENFDGVFFTYREPCIESLPICNDKELIIIDSVIDSGKTIQKIIKNIPKTYKYRIHVICLSINIKSLNVIESLKSRVSFHCLGFSNKEDRPTGKRDMGARLFGTES